MELIHYAVKIGKGKTFLKKGTAEEVKALIGGAEIREAGAGAKALGFGLVASNNGKTIFLKEKI